MRNFEPSPKTTTYDLQKLRGIHNEILRMHLLGVKNSDIARDLDVTPQMVCYTVKSELGQERIKDLNGLADDDAIDIKAKIIETLPDSVELLKKVMRGDTEFDDLTTTTRVRAAESLLDRGGFGKVQQVRGTVQHEVLIGAQRIKETARELGYIQDEVIDVEAEAVEV